MNIITTKKTISFKNYYQFDKEGIYIIKYIFKNNLTKTTGMFSECIYLITIDLSNFNSQNVEDISNMFYKSLLWIALI